MLTNYSPSRTRLVCRSPITSTSYRCRNQTPYSPRVMGLLQTASAGHERLIISNEGGKNTELYFTCSGLTFLCEEDFRLQCTWGLAGPVQTSCKVGVYICSKYRDTGKPDSSKPSAPGLPSAAVLANQRHPGTGTGYLLVRSVSLVLDSKWSEANS